jgi:hypothetical protein
VLHSMPAGERRARHSDQWFPRWLLWALAQQYCGNWTNHNFLSKHTQDTTHRCCLQQELFKPICTKCAVNDSKFVTSSK